MLDVSTFLANRLGHAQADSTESDAAREHLAWVQVWAVRENQHHEHTNWASTWDATSVVYYDDLRRLAGYEPREWEANNWPWPANPLARRPSGEPRHRRTHRRRIGRQNNHPWSPWPPSWPPGAAASWSSTATPKPRPPNGSASTPTTSNSTPAR